MTLDCPLDFAQAYAQAGYKVIPVNGKIPLVEHGAHDATTAEATIRAWWAKWPDANIGITLDNLVVVDIDPRNGGDVENLPHPLRDTCYARTGGGGLHYLYRASNGTRYPGHIAPGVDVKHGAGAYIVVEPSVHASGEKYCWLDETEPWTTSPTEAPAWLAIKPEAPGADRAGDNQRPIDWLDSIAAGVALHDSLRDMAAHYASLGIGFVEICKLLELAMHSSKAPRDERWQARFNAIPGLVNSAITKFRSPAKQAEIIVKRSPIDWAELATRGEPPGRRWAIGGWWGFGHSTSMVGSGGIGKTLVAQQIASCLALGRKFIGEVTVPLRVLMWCCEDDCEELWRRQLAIARWLDVPLSDFAGNLIIEPRAGLENTLASSEYSRLTYTPLIEELRQQAGDYRADAVILDNTAQLFGGNENDRHQVTSFLNNLTGTLQDKAVLLLAHPARSAGSEFSGSSAWEAVVRTRLFLGSKLPDQTANDDEPDDTVRFLCRRKANYSNRDYRRFQYRDGVLIPDEVEATASGGLLDHLRHQRAERVVLDGLFKLTTMEVRAVDSANSPAFLPRLILEYKLAEGCTKRELADAMRTAMLDGKLIRGVVGKYSNRSSMHGLMVAA